MAGFIQVISSSVNITFDGFTARNVTLVNGISLVWLVGLPEDVDSPTTFTIRDTVLEDIVEVEDEAEVQDTGIGLVFDISGPTNFVVENLSARDIQFTCII